MTARGPTELLEEGEVGGPDFSASWGEGDVIVPVGGDPVAAGADPGRPGGCRAWRVAGLGGGTGAAYSTGRFMTGTVSGDLLRYNLYTTTGRTTVLGDGTDSSATLAGTGTGYAVANNQTTSVFGRIFTLQDLSADAYSDSVTVDLVY